MVPGTNNLGNIKGPGVAATDNQTGSTDQYRAYATPDAFGSDFANLITGRYQDALGTGSDAAAYGKALQSGGYAEDSKYASKLSGAVDLVRRFGDAIASALSGSANAAELTPAQQGAAPVISPTGQRINQAPPGAAVAVAGNPGASVSPGSSGDPLLDMANGLMSGKPATPAQPTPTVTAPPAAGNTAPAQGDDPLLSMANSVMSSKAAPSAPGAAASPSASASSAAAASWPGGELGRQLGLTARAAGHGIADAVDLVGAPLNATINTLFGVHLHNPGDAIRNATDAVTPAPENALERIVNAGAAGMAGAGPLAKAGTLVANVANPIVRAIGAELAAAPGSQIIGGATGAMSSQAAAQAGANPIVQMLAGAIGGGAGFAGARGVGAGVDRGLAAAGPVGEMPIAARVEPSMPPAPSKPRVIPNGDGTFTQVSPAASTPAPSVPGAATTSPTPSAGGSTLRGVGAAQTDLNPYAGQLTGEEAARGGVRRSRK